MARRKQRFRGRRRPRASPANRAVDNRVTEFLTVAWMLSVLTALGCELGSAGALWYVRSRPDALRIAALSSVLLFAELVIGVLSLLLMAAVWKLRRPKPPAGVSVFALVVGAVPLVAMVLQRVF